MALCEVFSRNVSEESTETTTHLSQYSPFSDSNIKQAPLKYSQQRLSQSDLSIALYASGRNINKTRRVNGSHKAHCFRKEIDIGLSLATVVNTCPTVCCTATDGTIGSRFSATVSNKLAVWSNDWYLRLSNNT
jgi:hypothetical protein